MCHSLAGQLGKMHTSHRTSAKLPAPLLKTVMERGADGLKMQAIFTLLQKSVPGKIKITYVDYEVIFMAAQSKIIFRSKGIIL